MKKSYILLGIFLFAAAGIIFYSLYHAARIEKEAVKASPAVRQTSKEALPVAALPVLFPLVPANPADYGMVVTETTNTGFAQSQWDRIISEKIRQTKEQYSPQDWQKVKEFIKEDPEKTAEKLKQIDAKMRVYQDQLSADPTNEKIKGRMERLKMLKSIARGLLEAA